jgi:hypothetical protein
VVVTTPGSEYIGGDHYFINEDTEDSTVNPHIRIVPTIDPTILRNSNKLPEPIALSIITFFLGSAVLRLQGNTKKYTYLLHTSFKQADHSVMFRLVDEFRNGNPKQLQEDLILRVKDSRPLNNQKRLHAIFAKLQFFVEFSYQNAYNKLLFFALLRKKLILQPFF